MIKANKSLLMLFAMILRLDNPRWRSLIDALGDRSAHDRQFTATKPDLDRIQIACRGAIEELLHVARLK